MFTERDKISKYNMTAVDEVLLKHLVKSLCDSEANERAVLTCAPRASNVEHRTPNIELRSANSEHPTKQGSAVRARPPSPRAHAHGASGGTEAARSQQGCRKKGRRRRECIRRRTVHTPIPNAHGHHLFPSRIPRPILRLQPNPSASRQPAPFAPHPTFVTV